jgi:hypothetical protein
MLDSGRRVAEAWARRPGQLPSLRASSDGIQMPAQRAKCQTLARLHGPERQVELIGQSALRLVAEIAMLDQLALLARQRRDGAAQVPLELG